ncbi:MAG: hypothetical protein H7321_01250, partial [Bacteroidia bacterium]|nr:hypothetical protein [Bacteroidia bacterium]
AVGVGAKYDSGFVKANFYADTLVCNSASTVKFTNLSTNSKKAYWTFGDSKKDSTYNATHVYPGYGSYTVKLKAISCFKNISDSITKTAYVRIDSMHDICNSTLMPANKIDTVNKCQGFVYDRGGEGYYYNLETGTLVISPTNADSISVWFKVFDYEAGYDFLSLYNGPNTGSPLIGTYTGTSLPKGGLRIVATSGKLTIKHTSDQMVTGQGFKFYFTAHRKLPKIKAFKDTSICYGTSAKITAVLSQGVSPDITYTWDKGLGTGNIKTVQPIVDTKYRVIAFDQCLKVRDTAFITVKVRKPLKIKVPRDTTFCYGIKYNLIAKGTGGDSLKYAFKWSDGNLKDTNKITTSVTTKYRIILSDGCTVKSDTGYVNIKVLKALTVKATGGDSICKGSQIKLFATPKGGDSSKYNFFWTLGAPPTDTVRINPLFSGWYKITLSDNCSAKPANDSTYVTIFSPLALTLTPKDTTICYGTGLNISAKIKGGDKKTYKFGWVPGVPQSYNDFVMPAKTTYYRFTATDKCNVPVKDSIHIVVRKPVKITLTKDTTICFGRDVILNVSATGGDSTKYVFRWDNGLPNGPSNKVMPNSSTFYRASVYDGCSAFGDSSQVIVYVLNPISVSLSNDTTICSNGAARIIATTSGGNV